MRGAGGSLSPARAARRKPPSSCCSFSTFSTLSLCLSLAFLVFMATHLRGTRDSKVAHSQPTEVSTARKLSGEGLDMRRGYEQAGQKGGGRKMDLEEELERDLSAAQPLHEREGTKRNRNSRTRGGEQNSGRPKEVPLSEWMSKPEVGRTAAKAGVNKFAMQQGGEDAEVFGESEWERIQRERTTGGVASEEGSSEVAKLEGELVRSLDMHGAFANMRAGDMQEAKDESEVPDNRGGGFGVRIEVDESSSFKSTDRKGDFEGGAFEMGGSTLTMQETKPESTGQFGTESIELGSLGQGQANQLQNPKSVGRQEEGNGFRVAQDSGQVDQIPSAVTVKLDEEILESLNSEEDVGQANPLDSRLSARPQEDQTEREALGVIGATQANRARNHSTVDKEGFEGDSRSPTKAGHSDQVEERPLLHFGEKPTKQVLMVKEFFKHNDIESLGHVSDDDGSSESTDLDKRFDDDLALAVLPEYGDNGMDSLFAAASSLSEAGGSSQNALFRISESEAPHPLLAKHNSSSQHEKILVNGLLVDVPYRQALLRSFQEGLDCMAPGLELFDGNASLMTGASAYASCAFVGNSGMMRAAERGAEIDGHDVILRSNQAPTKGYDNFVGSKTTFRFLNKKWAVVYGSANQGRSILLPQEDPGTVLIASRSEEPEYSRLVQAVGETRPDITAVHLSGEVRRCAHVALQSARQAANGHDVAYEGGDVPSTGFLAIFFLLQACESVDAYGLSMEQSDGHVARSWPYHYFEHYVDSENLRAHPHHSFEMEGDLARAMAVERPARLRIVEEPHSTEPE